MIAALLALLGGLACDRPPTPNSPRRPGASAPTPAPREGDDPPRGVASSGRPSAAGNPNAPGGLPPDAGADSPRATLERLMRLRGEAKYRELIPLLAPPGGAAVADALRAVDDFLAANRRLCAWVRDRVGIGLAEAIDQGYLGDELSLYLGGSMSLFARGVVLLDETIDGDVARVSFTVGGRLPAECALLRRHGGAWRYDPQAALNPLVNGAFLDMARALDALRAELESGRPAPEELRRNRDRLMDKVQARLRRGVSLLNRAQAADRPTSTPESRPAAPPAPD